MSSTVAKFAPLKVYVELRDDLWHTLSSSSLPSLPSVKISPYSLGLLELANRVVFIITSAQTESLSRTLALLRCQTCDLFIARIKTELRAARRGQSPPRDVEAAVSAAIPIRENPCSSVAKSP